MRRLTADEFRDVIGRFASGVTVVSAAHEGRYHGTTANAVTSLSLDPPMILVSLNRESETGRAIERCGFFAVNILGEGDADLAVRFAQKGGEKFEGVPVSSSGCGAPLLEDALASLECRVVEAVPAATHTVFLAEVENASAREGTPLAYFRGRYGRLELPGERPPLAPEGLADAVRARSAIESGAAALTVGRVGEDQLAALRGLVAEMPGRPSAQRWLEDEREFADRLVGLAGSAELLEAHRRIGLGIRVGEARLAADGVAVPSGAQFDALLDAYAAGDLPGAIAAITQRAEDVKRLAAAAIGGAQAAS